MIAALIEVGLCNDLSQLVGDFITGNLADMEQHEIVDYLQSNPDLSRVVFNGVDLSGVDLSNANLSNANLANANLTNVTISGVILTSIRCVHTI